MRKDFVSLGEFIAGSSSFYKTKPKGDLSAEILSSKPFHSLLRDESWIDNQCSGLKYALRGDYEKPSQFYARIMNRPDDYFLVSIMVSGFRPGCWMYDLLRANGKVSDFSLIGYTEGRYTHYGDHDKNIHEIIGKVLVPPAEFDRLNDNKDKPTLVIDDAIVDGSTLRVVTDTLKKGFGFRELYSMSASKFYMLS
jgi:hypothetical protein